MSESDMHELSKGFFEMGDELLRQKHDAALIAPPCNAALSTEPNKTQTIVNVVTAEGPMTRDRLLQRMRELLGPERATKTMIHPLIHELVRTHRLFHDEDDILSIP